MKPILICFLALFSINLTAQGVKISPQPGNPDPSAILETQDTTRGVLMPRVNLQSSTDAVTISNPATALMVFNTGTTLAPAGFYYNAGTPQAPQWALVLPNPANTDLNMNGFAIENLATPVNPNDAVTKDYVDNQIINVSGSGGGACHCPTMMTDEFNSTNIATAMRNCSNLNQGGFSDWYLPDLKDITFILSFDSGSIANNTSGNYIWTRSECIDGGCRFYIFRFSDGYLNASGGQYNNAYRCVR